MTYQPFLIKLNKNELFDSQNDFIIADWYKKVKKNITYSDFVEKLEKELKNTNLNPQIIITIWETVSCIISRTEDVFNPTTKANVPEKELKELKNIIKTLLSSKKNVFAMLYIDAEKNMCIKDNNDTCALINVLQTEVRLFLYSKNYEKLFS